MKTKLTGILLLMLLLSGCSGSKQSTTYVCDYSQYFAEYENVEIEVELIHRDENLLKEVSIQRFHFFDSSSSYQKEFLMQDIQTFDDGGYKVELKESDDYYEIITTIDYENLSEDYKAILVNSDGSVPLQESVDYLEANNCVRK